MFDRTLDACNEVLRLHALCVVFKAQQPVFVRTFLGHQSCKILPINCCII